MVSMGGDTDYSADVGGAQGSGGPGDPFGGGDGGLSSQFGGRQIANTNVFQGGNFGYTERSYPSFGSFVSQMAPSMQGVYNTFSGIFGGKPKGELKAIGTWAPSTNFMGKPSNRSWGGWLADKALDVVPGLSIDYQPGGKMQGTVSPFGAVANVVGRAATLGSPLGGMMAEKAVNAMGAPTIDAFSFDAPAYGKDPTDEEVNSRIAANNAELDRQVAEFGGKSFPTYADTGYFGTPSNAGPAVPTGQFNPRELGMTLAAMR